MAARRFNSTDHDLLIAIDTKLTSLTQSVNDFSNKTNTRLDDLDEYKADTEEVEDVAKDVLEVSKRVDSLYRLFWIGVGGVAAFELLIRIIPNIRWVG